jgi:TatD DNase family protein
MELLPYVDIHTHAISDNIHLLRVFSLNLNSIHDFKPKSEKMVAGIHPWWVEDISSDEIENLKLKITQLLDAKLLWGVGETGIDRTLPEFLDLQKELFSWHIDLSEKFRRPLIIHNVRAGSDILEILKLKKPQMPWIFHDFRGSIQLVHDLLRLHPETYFSFGISLDNSPQIRELLPQLPLSQVFLETDMQTHLDIHDIYIRASGILGMDIEFLKSQFWFNFTKIETYLT